MNKRYIETLFFVSKCKEILFIDGNINRTIYLNNTLIFKYDNFGNCIEGFNAKMEWQRGSLLENYEGNDKLTFKYDVSGNRIEKKVNDKTIKYLYDNNKLIAEKHSDGIVLQYLYDAQGIIGFEIYKFGQYQKVYYFIKDITGNVISIVDKDVEVARYEYDSWGMCSIVYNNDISFDIANLNPIRWKSQYYDMEMNFYYINNRYYSPKIRMFICSQSIDTVLYNVKTLFSLNLYSLNVANTINLLYNNHTIFTEINVQNEPEVLSGWKRFWRSELGGLFAILITIVAVIVCLVTQNYALLIGAIVTIVLTLIIGGALAGYASSKQGDNFWRGFFNHINNEWSQTVSIEMITTLVSVGLAKIAKCFSKAKKADAVADVAGDIPVEKTSGLTKDEILSIKDQATNMPSGEYSVYLSTSDDYVGITKDFGRRSKEHLKKSERTITEIVSGVDKNSARIIEQAVIDYVGKKVNQTGTLANLINSISPSSQLYQEVLKFII